MTNISKKQEQSQNRLVVFEDKQIRRIFHNGEWYFSIIDIVAVLSESSNPRRCWSALKIQLTKNEGFIQLYGKTVQLKLEEPFKGSVDDYRACVRKERKNPKKQFSALSKM
jgi:prophage antirepressor-like protein